jgi:polyhydroxybutyrate depolymerase
MSTSRRLAGLICLAVVVLTAAACGRSGITENVPSAGLPAGESRRDLRHDGRDRSYLVYLPASTDLSRPVPLVFVFHGGTGNARSAVRMSGMNAVADAGGFVAVYPNGTGRLRGDRLLTWNGGDCCGYAQQKDVDDVGFVRAVIADLESLLPLDADRVYATGMSNGAILSHRLGCEAADVFAAIAPVAGTLNFAPCAPSRPVSVIEFHGTADRHILYEGGNGPDALVDTDFASVRESVDFWVETDGCAADPQTARAEGVRHDTWTGCRVGSSVELYTIEGGGHAWPGGAAGRRRADSPGDLQASQLIWEFFAAHPRA